jgi:chromate transporter
MHADSTPPGSAPLPPEQRDSWRAFLRAFAWIGLNSFGGPVAQIGVMHEEAVEKRGWVTGDQFLQLLNFANLLPGPEALELAIHLGWLRRGVAGGLVAGMLFVLPGFVSLTALGWLYVTWGRLELVSAILDGIRPVGIGLIAAAALRISAKALGDRLALALCGGAFLAKYLLDVPFVLLLVACGAMGIILASRGAARVDAPLRFAFFGLLVAVVVALSFTRSAPVSPDLAAPSQRVVSSSDPERLAAIAWVNTKAALVTFGGAYTVLPYLREQFVDRHRWLPDAAMIDALALAETTPGPLISVGVFLSYLAGGFAGACVGALFLFGPSFLFVLGLSRHMLRIERLPRSREFLRGVSAGTLGLILALSAQLVPSMVRDPFSAAVGLAAFVAVVRWKANVIAVVAAGAALGALQLAL